MSAAYFTALRADGAYWKEYTQAMWFRFGNRKIKTIKELAASATTVRDRGYHGQPTPRASVNGVRMDDSCKGSKQRSSRLNPEKVVIERHRKALISSEDIAFRAWQLWQEDGCPMGKDLEHWCRAEKELLAQ